MEQDYGTPGLNALLGGTSTATSPNVSSSSTSPVVNGTDYGTPGLNKLLGGGTTKQSTTPTPSSTPIDTSTMFPKSSNSPAIKQSIPDNSTLGIIKNTITGIPNVIGNAFNKVVDATSNLITPKSKGMDFPIISSNLTPDKINTSQTDLTNRINNLNKQTKTLDLTNKNAVNTYNTKAQQLQSDLNVFNKGIDNYNSAQKAKGVISGEGIIPVGQTIKVPFINAGFTVPSGDGIGAGYSALKSAIEMPERAIRSVAERFGAPTMDKRTSAYDIPSYAEVASKNTADAIDAGMPAVAAVILNSAQAGGEFAQDALWYSGLLESGAAKVDTEATKITTDELKTAHEFLGNPATMEEAKANYIKLQKEFHPDITGGDDTISKQANNAYRILQKEGIPGGEAAGKISTMPKKAEMIYQLPDGTLKTADLHPTLVEETAGHIKTHGEEMTHQAIQERLGATPEQASHIIDAGHDYNRNMALTNPEQSVAESSVKVPETPKYNTNIPVLKAFANSKPITTIGNFELGSYGKNSGARKMSGGQTDRFSISELPETEKNITESYRASNNPNNYRYDNIAHIAEMPDGTKRVIYTRENAQGKEEIINWHNVSNPDTYIKQLKSFGAPERSRTSISSLERSSPDPLNDKGNVPRGGVEPSTSPASRERSTTELSRLNKSVASPKEDVNLSHKDPIKQATEARKERLIKEGYIAPTENKTITVKTSTPTPNTTSIAPKQIVTKTALKDIFPSLGKSVDFKVVEENGKKYMTFSNDKTSVKLRPSALGLLEDNIKIGDTVNINADSLKEKGTEFRGVGDNGMVLASGINPGLDKLIEQDIKPAAKTIIGGVIKTWDFIKKVLNPASRGLEAEKTASIMTESLARMAHSKENAYKALQNASKTVDKMGEKEALILIDNIETGKTTPGNEKFVQTMRDALDARYKKISAISGSDAYIENYFPHIWEDQEEAKNVLAQHLGKRPLQGTKSFLQQRTIPTIKEGIALGLKPVSYNPVELIMAKIADMDKFLMAHDVWTKFKEEGLRKFVRTGEKPPSSWIQVNDKISKSFRFSPTEKALVSNGNWYMPEQAATIVNNYLSPGLSNNPMYNAFRMLGNTLNQAQLGLSAYHITFTSVDAIVSKSALESQKLTSANRTIGERVVALGKIVTAVPASPYLLYKNLARGNALMKDYFRDNPQIPQLVDALQKAGGRAKMDSFYKNNAVGNFLKALRSGNLIGAFIRAPFAITEGLSRVIMEDIVPRQKLGVFSDMATDILQEAERGNWSEYKTTLRLQEAWRSVDNRMGQLVYDNLFWNKILKDLGMASVRSLGWNIGSLQELPGGAIDFAKLPGKIINQTIRGKAPKNENMGTPRMTPKMAYLINLPLVVGVIGAIIYYMYHGKAPEKLEDYYVIPTNKLKSDGSPEKIQIASYMKDVFAYNNDAAQTLKNKLHPQLSTISQMLDNKDYFGTEIRNPNDPLVNQLEDLMKYEAKQFIPFSITNMKQREQAAGGDLSAGDYLANFMGVTPAPAYLTRTPIQNDIVNLYVKRFGGASISKETFANNKVKSNIKALYRDGKTEEANAALDDAVSKGIIKERGVTQFIAAADTPSDIQMFKRLTPEDQTALIKKMPLVDINKYAWYANSSIMDHFGTISPAADNWVSMVEKGEVKEPTYVAGKLQEEKTK